MRLSTKPVKITFQKWMAFVIVLLAINTTTVVFAQDDDQDPAAVDPAPSRGQSGTLSSGPWSNSATTTPVITRNSSSAPSAQRPVAGGTVLDDPNPGGNPDVPFDDNMNLVFLAIGLVFAFVVYKKRTGLKTAAVK